MLVLTILKGPDKGRRFELPDNEPQLIGRSSESLPLKDQTISRRHAELTPDDGKWFICDLASSNGTFVNGVRLTGRRLLGPGDQVRTGSSVFLFGQESKKQSSSVLMAKRGEIDAHVSAAVISNDDSMIMAVPEPSQAAVLQLKVIYELTQLIGSIVDQQKLLERVMDVIFDYFQADRGFILLYDKHHSRFEPTVIRYRVPHKDARQAKIEVSQTILQHVLGRGEGVLSSNAMTDKRFAGGDSVQHYSIRSAMCVPIKFKQHTFGVIHVDSQVANYTYTEDQLRLLTAVGVQTGLALANAQHYAQRLHQERLAAVGQTVASLSHSIKNILQGLRGGADVVELGLRKDSMKVVRGGWEIVSRNLDRIYGLAMNMLTYSKQRKPDLEITNLPQLLGEVVSLMQSRFDHKRIALITDFNPHMPPVPLDPSGVHQAVLNMVVNACDAVESGGGVVTIRCEYEPKTHHAKISVHDNGKGVSAESIQNLFKPFYSTKGLRGTGLGLVVSKKVAEEHGGKITVESSPRRGTSFTLWLPTEHEAIPSSADTHSPSLAATKLDIPAAPSRGEKQP